MSNQGSDNNTPPASINADVIRSTLKVQPESANDLIKQQEEWQAKFSNESVKVQEAYTHLTGLQAHYKDKSKWSAFLMWTMGGMIVFQSVLLLMVGFKILDFTDYEWLLPALLIQNLGQVIGLALFVVKSLFKDLR